MIASTYKDEDIVQRYEIYWKQGYQFERDNISSNKHQKERTVGEGIEFIKDLAGMKMNTYSRGVE